MVSNKFLQTIYRRSRDSCLEGMWFIISWFEYRYSPHCNCRSRGEEGVGNFCKNRKLGGCVINGEVEKSEKMVEIWLKTAWISTISVYYKVFFIDRKLGGQNKLKSSVKIPNFRNYGGESNSISSTYLIMNKNNW